MLKGHVKRAEGVVYHHKDKISIVELKLLTYRNLLHGWSVPENVKESRGVLKDMKGAGIKPDLFCYNMFLKCLCKNNVKSNPSGLVPDALNVMIEMRTYAIPPTTISYNILGTRWGFLLGVRSGPTTISYNILVSCLGKTRRVKESIQVFNTMRKTGCSPDWVTYYLVARVLYLMGRFGKGKQMVDEMIEDGLVPERKFYYDLIGILCGVERVKYALKLLELMKKSSLGGYETVYDLLIPKLCRNGEFEKGKELYDEAIAMGLTLECSSDMFNPLITKVFKPVRKMENEVAVLETPKRKPVGRCEEGSLGDVRMNFEVVKHCATVLFLAHRGWIAWEWCKVGWWWRSVHEGGERVCLGQGARGAKEASMVVIRCMQGGYKDEYGVGVMEGKCVQIDTWEACIYVRNVGFKELCTRFGGKVIQISCIDNLYSMPSLPTLKKSHPVDLVGCCSEVWNSVEAWHGNLIFVFPRELWFPPFRVPFYFDYRDTTLSQLLDFSIYNFYWFFHKAEFVIESNLFSLELNKGFSSQDRHFFKIRNVEGIVDISEFFRKLKFVCHWADPFKDLKWSNVLGVKLSSFSKSDDTFLR
ncbi:pentatricopeptide repeat-containing protein [Tanacetum coccineum]